MELNADNKGQLWFTESDRDCMKISYKVKKNLYEGKSAFQNIAVLDLYDYGVSLILDGAIQTTELDSRIYNEMLVHIPSALHKNVENVLIIGAGACGNIRELVKYTSVKNIDVVEIDEEVVKVCLEHMPQISDGSCDDPRVKFHYDDGDLYLSQADMTGKYDLVLVDSSDPTGPSEKLFQRDFYQKISNALNKSGIVVCQSESVFFYKDILGSIYDNLSAVFPVAQTYYFPMPCFPGGLWSLTLGSKLFTSDDADPSIIPDDTVFVQRDKINSYFNMPAVIKGKL